MMRVIVWTAILAASLLALACGDDDGDKKEKHGALDVQVLAVSHGSAGPLTADVRAIVIELDGDVDYQLTLTQRSDIEYIGKFTKVLGGSYIASALAYDNFEGKGEPLFKEEKASPITIEKGKTAGLVFAISRLLPDGQLSSPYFTSVVFDRTAVGPDEVISIQVEAAGGTGALTLSGRHADNAEIVGLFDSPDEFDPTAEAGQIGWRAPAVAGPIWFALVLTDTEGNQAEIGMTVFVGADLDGVFVTAGFNFAPELDLEVRTSLDDAVTPVTFLIDAVDDATGTMTFVFDGDCGGEFVPAIPGNTFAQASPVKTELTYVFERREKACWLSLQVTDEGGASSKKVVTFGASVAVEGPISTTFNGFDAINAHEFAPITVQPTLVSSYSATAKIVVRLTLTRAGVPVTGDFARYEDDYVSSVTPASPNTLTLSSYGRTAFGPGAGFGAADLKAGPTLRLGLIGLAAGDYALFVEYIDVTAGNRLIAAAQEEFTVH